MEVIEIDDGEKSTAYHQRLIRSLSPEIGVSFSTANQDSPTSGQENSSHRSTPPKSDSGNPPVTPKGVSSGPRVRLTTAQKEVRNREVEERKRQAAEEKRLREEKKLEEKRLKEEKKKRLEEERQAKEAEKLLEKQQREAERLKKLEEKNRRDQEAQQKKAEKDAEVARKEQLKTEERKRKEEERLQKEEEKKKKEEDRLRKEEAKRIEEEKKEEKLRRQQDCMKRFLVVKQAPIPKFLPGSDVGSTLFKPYQIQDGVVIAKLQRVDALSACRVTAMDSLISGEANAHFNEKQNLYLGELKSGLHRPRKCGPTFPPEKTEIQLVGYEKPRPKLIQFSDNTRPPYYGTMRLESCTIRPRNPFAEDTSMLDYEVDSDEEWADDQNAESVASGADEEESSEEELDDEEAGFFINDEIMEGEDEQDELSAEAAYERKKVESVVQRWMNTKKVRRPVKQVIGPYWADQENNCPALLKSLAALQLYDPVEEDAGTAVLTHESLGQFVSKIPASFMPYVIKTVHGSNVKRGVIAAAFFDLLQNRQDIEVVSKFIAYDEQLPVVLESLELGKWSSKENLKKAILDFAEWKRPPNNGNGQHQKICWYVKEAARDLYSVLEGHTLPNPSCLVNKRTNIDPNSAPKNSDSEIEPAKKKPRMEEDLLTTPKLMKSGKEITLAGKTANKIKEFTVSGSKQRTLDAFIKKDANTSTIDEKNISIATDSDMDVQMIDLTSDQEGSN